MANATLLPWAALLEKLPPLPAAAAGSSNTVAGKSITAAGATSAAAAAPSSPRAHIDLLIVNQRDPNVGDLLKVRQAFAHLT